jgi:hypothetical protein
VGAQRSSNVLRTLVGTAEVRSIEKRGSGAAVGSTLGTQWGVRRSAAVEPSEAKIAAHDLTHVMRVFFEPSDVAQQRSLCMFPEKRFFFSNQELTTSKVAIHTNLFTDYYGLIGTGSFESGWFTTIMKLPFIFCIWLGFLLATIGGALALKRQLQKSKLIWV